MKHQYIALLFLILLSGITACTEDELIRNNTFSGQDVNISAFRPQDVPATKADIKEEFKQDDIIHISTVFTIDGKTSEITYACLKYDGTKWSAIDNTSLTWPEGCKTADFTAYYYPSKNALTTGGKFEQPMSVLDDENNPLKATVSRVSPGGVVYLQFEHLCTKLTLTDLKVGSENITDGKELWLTQANLKNGCSLVRNSDGTLSFDFIQLTNSKDTISNKQVKDGKTCFFLSPGNYEHIKLNYRYNKPYLSFDIPELQNLNAGRHYTLNITNLPGNMVSGSLKEEEYWNNNDEGEWVKLQDINKFLYAIAYNEDYIEGGIKILEKSLDKTDGTVIMLKHVDFNGLDFTPVELSNAVEFNANFRTIRNVKLRDKNNYATIFKTVAGSIENLALENITGDNLTSGYIGGLAGEVTGNISNIKVKGTNEIIVKLVEGTNGTKVGALIGEFGGSGNKLDKIEITGKLTISTTGTTSDDVYIGAIVGSSTSKITNSTVNGDISIINSCENNGGTFYSGGITGFISTEMSNCITNASVDASSAKANILYTGGLAGRGESKIENCDASGEVKGGTATGDGNTKGNYTGGCIGEYVGGDINNCYALGNITATDGITGGLIGRILISNANNALILNSASFGQVNSTNAGGFVGKTEKGTDASGTITINNSFSISTGSATLFIGSGETNATINNCHFNGFDSLKEVTSTELNTGRNAHNDWLEWTSSSNLFNGHPYLIRK